MFPEDGLTVQLSAVDSAGNCDSVAMPIVSIRTTDTTQPSQPKLRPNHIAEWIHHHLVGIAGFGGRHRRPIA